MQPAGGLSKDGLKAFRFYNIDGAASCEALRTDAANGLAIEAAVARLAEFGPNEMTPPRKHGLLKKIWDQLANILIVILLAAAVVAGILKDWIEFGFIFGVILINVVIGVVQESKAEKAADALKKLLSPSAIVVRDGVRASINANQLVPGDIFFLEAGDRVPADGRLLTATNLAVMEAALTGESVAAPKEADTLLPTDATLADRHNMVYAGCMVTAGQCRGVVTATGDHNEIGKINKLVQNVEAGKTPLLVQIEVFGRWLSVAVIGVAIITLLVAHFARHVAIGEAFKIAVSVAVAIIPEGLPSVLTIILAFGVKAMAEKHAIIRQMPAVETLGAVSVICSDKTGTLTKNEMTAVQLRLGSDATQAYRFTGQGFSPEGDVRRGDATLHTKERLKTMFALLPAILCNDAALSVASTKGKGDDEVPKAVVVDAGKPAFPAEAEPVAPASPPRADNRSSGSAASATPGSNALASPVQSRAAIAELRQNMSLEQVAAVEVAAGHATGHPSGRISFHHTASASNLSALSPGGTGVDDSDAAAFAATAGQFTAMSYASGAQWTLTGDPTEGALLVAAMKAGWKNAREAQARFPRLSTVPFDSDNKFMASLHDVLIPRTLLGPAVTQADDGGSSVTVPRRVMLVKGAPDRIIPRCATATHDGNPFNAPPIDAAAWQASADSLASEGMRVLALAMAVVPNDKTSISAADITTGDAILTLTALVGIVDPPREECVAAIQECKTASVRVVMITGDSPLTAKTIGNWLGIPAAEVISGQQMQAMSDDELTQRVLTCSIYARATPEHKMRIIQALHRNKLTAAMTGDGVNDAPALKAANVGIAMGITGTEVAKEASRMVLADDNFATIVAAIKEGRRVYDNLRKVLLFVLPTNVAQGICILAAIAIGLPFPLNAIQILWVNMLTSVTLGLVLALEPAEPGVMERPPRRSGKSIVGKQLLWRCFFVGTLLIIAMLGNMYWELKNDGWVSSEADDEVSPVLSRGRAVAMTTLTSGQVSYIFSCRYLKASSLRWDILHTNPMLLLMCALNVGLQCLLIYAPGIQDAFGLAPISGLAWLRCIAIASALFYIVEVEKVVGPRFIRPFFDPCLRACTRAAQRAVGPCAAKTVVSNVEMPVAHAATSGIPASSPAASPVGAAATNPVAASSKPMVATSVNDVAVTV